MEWNSDDLGDATAVARLVEAPRRGIGSWRAIVVRKGLFISGTLGATCGALLGAAWAEIQLVLDFDPSQFSAFPPPSGLLFRCTVVAALVGLAAGFLVAVICARLATRRARIAVMLLAGALLGADVPFLYGWSAPQGRPLLLGLLGALLAVVCYRLGGNAFDGSDSTRSRVLPQFSLQGMLLTCSAICAALALVVSGPGQRWHARQVLAENGFRVTTSSGSPEWIVWLVGVRTRNYLIRVDSIFGDLPPQAPPGLLAAFERFPEIEELGVGDVSDADLRHFAGLTQLRRLSLSGAGVTGSGLKHLDGLTQLRRLSLSGAGLTGSGLEHLDGLTQLRRLSLTGAGLIGPGLKHLAGLPHLEYLYLNRTGLDDEGLASLERLPSLAHLDVSETAITDAGLERISRLERLESLSLSRTKVTDGGLRHVAGLVHLKELDLYCCPVGDAGLSALADLPQLQMVRLGSTQITDAGMPYLSRIRRLEHLDFSGTTVTDAGLMQLVELPELKGIWAPSGCLTQSGVDDFDVRRKTLGLKPVMIGFLPGAPPPAASAAADVEP